MSYLLVALQKNALSQGDEANENLAQGRELQFSWKRNGIPQGDGTGNPAKGLGTLGTPSNKFKGKYGNEIGAIYGFSKSQRPKNAITPGKQNCLDCYGTVKNYAPANTRNKDNSPRVYGTVKTHTGPKRQPTYLEKLKKEFDWKKPYEP